MWSPGSAATSSRCCCRRCGPSPWPPRWPHGCAPPWPSRCAWRACRSRSRPAWASRRTGVETYVARADRYSPARLSLLGDLRRGIDRGEFELHYLPKVFLATGRTAGMEALLRWRHPDRGLIGPAEFIPLAEQSFLMRELTAHVVQL